jgi:RNA polymerase sigma-70 factor (ECF subfamily)
VDRQTSDNEIRARLAANDSSALEMIWNLYASDLLGYLVSVLRSMPDAEDVLQEMFVTIARNRDAVAGARLLKPYLFRMARNAAVNRIKRDTRMRNHLDEAPAWLVLGEEAEARDDRGRGLTSALEALPEEQRTVIVLKHYREKTFREIGELLGISENTAGSRYRYGMQKLRDLIRETPP